MIVRFDHIANRIINPNHRIMRAAVEFLVIERGPHSEKRGADLIRCAALIIRLR